MILLPSELLSEVKCGQAQNLSVLSYCHSGWIRPEMEFWRLRQTSGAEFRSTRREDLSKP